MESAHVPSPARALPLRRWLRTKRSLYLTAPAIPLLLPLAAWLAQAHGHGGWFWMPAAFLFAVVPVLDTLLGEDPANPEPDEVAGLAADPWYRHVLYAAVISHWFALLVLTAAIATGNWPWHAILGAVLSAGGINGLALLVGHELGHKTRDTLQCAMARVVLAVTGYGHFSAEHNEGNEDVAHGGGGGDEGDDAHRAATDRTHQREHCVDAGHQQRPSVAGGTTMRRFGGGFRVGCGRRGGRGQGEGGYRSAQR